MKVARNNLATDKPVALGFPIELEFRSVDLCGGRKTGEAGEKPSEQGREPTTNSTHIWHRAGIEPGPHWCEASALTTAPSHPCCFHVGILCCFGCQAIASYTLASILPFCYVLDTSECSVLWITTKIQTSKYQPDSRFNWQVFYCNHDPTEISSIRIKYWHEKNCYMEQ